MPADAYARWLTTRFEARIWWCGDEHCDCTEPVLDRITPNHRAGYPWIHRETIWSGTFGSGNIDDYDSDRIDRQQEELRQVCRVLAGA